MTLCGWCAVFPAGLWFSTFKVRDSCWMVLAEMEAVLEWKHGNVRRTKMWKVNDISTFSEYTQVLWLMGPFKQHASNSQSLGLRSHQEIAELVSNTESQDWECGSVDKSICSMRTWVWSPTPMSSSQLPAIAPVHTMSTNTHIYILTPPPTYT